MDDAALWMGVLDVYKMMSWVLCCVPAVLTDIQLPATLLRRELDALAMNLASVRLQGASLSKSFSTALTFVRPHS